MTPITKYLLISAGFERRGSGYYLDPFYIYLPGSPQSDYGFGIKGVGLVRSVKYMEQIGRLYFALIDKKL
jgi:hypothetical protein